MIDCCTHRMRKFEGFVNGVSADAAHSVRCKNALAVAFILGSFCAVPIVCHFVSFPAAFFEGGGYFFTGYDKNAPPPLSDDASNVAIVKIIQHFRDIVKGI